MGRIEANKEAEYKCGKCGDTVYYLITEEAPDCPTCGWQYLEQSQYDVPSELKFSLKK